jgi:electron transport complex protein RnfC
VSGHGVRRPANLIVPVGTKLRDLLTFCGGLTEDAEEVLNGGPMMGLAQRDLDAPILKGTTGIVVLTHDDVRAQEVSPCIHCGRCLDACPMFLNPSLLGDLARMARYEEMDGAHLSDCMLCGACSYVCPSNIPLAQLFVSSKAALRKQMAVKAVSA